MSIEIPSYKIISLPVETQIINNNLSQSSINNFNNLLHEPSVIERSTIEKDNVISKNNILNQMIHSISTLDLNIKTSSNSLRQELSKNRKMVERPNNNQQQADTSSKTIGNSTSVTNLTGEMNHSLEKVKALYKIQHKFHKSMTFFTLFSSLLTAFKGTLDKFLKM